MVLYSLNWWAIIISAIAATVLGFLWYGLFFGKTWMDLSGVSQKDIKKAKEKSMTKAYVFNFIATFVMVFVLALLLEFTGSGITNGLLTGLFVWLGFIATTMLNSVLWEGKPFKLYLLNIFYYLISLLIAGAILSAWV